MGLNTFTTKDPNKFIIFCIPDSWGHSRWNKWNHNSLNAVKPHSKCSWVLGHRWYWHQIPHLRAVASAFREDADWFHCHGNSWFIQLSSWIIYWMRGICVEWISHIIPQSHVQTKLCAQGSWAMGIYGRDKSSPWVGYQTMVGLSLWQTSYQF